MDETWYRDAIIYQLHVRSFYDSNEDGVGDFAGLTQKLDYLADLGVTALWLLPFYPSPLRDDGYDIADFSAVHPAYGTLDDFQAFLGAAHARGLRVITELVMNHTSDQHPWFQASRRAGQGTAVRDFYVWSDTADRFREARVIFGDVETSNWTWDPVAGAYYWHRFFAHQPDLNYDNPAVRQAMLEACDFWLERGVDGLGLSTVSYLFEREGTSCEHLPETHAFLRELRAHVDARYAGRALLAEADAWPEDAAAYLDEGAECHLAADYALMPRLFMAIRQEDRFPVADIVRQTPAAPDGCQWVVFLRNHDELTLQMVTEEERDALYRSLAQDPQARVHRGIRRRLAPLLDNNRRQIELAHGLLFSLPGAAVIFYGDEIGMGDNIYLGDRASVRTPMQWSDDRNAGFSRANPQRLYLPVVTDPQYHYEAVNVDAELRDRGSLLRWMRRLIALRQRYPALGHGAIEFVRSANRKVLAFVRRGEAGSAEDVLVVANLSRFVEHAGLDLAGFQGRTPVEAVSGNTFPVVGEGPYLIMLGPYELYWFVLTPGEQEANGTAAGQVEPATITAADGWETVFEGAARAALEAALPGYMRPRRWFRGKARTIRKARIVDAIRVPYEGGPAYLATVRVDYAEGDAETYALPIGYAGPGRAAELGAAFPHALIARDEGPGGGAWFDATWDPGFSAALLDALAGSRSFGASGAILRAERTSAFAALHGGPGAELAPTVGRAEQSNTSIRFGQRLILKLYRRLEEGINPDLEVPRYLTEHGSFGHIPRVAGSLAYVPAGSRTPLTLGMLQAFVPNQGDAWEYTLGALGAFIERASAATVEPPPGRIATQALLDLAGQEPPDLVRAMMGDYLDAARLLGVRTAEMHLALAAGTEDPAFATEPFTPLYQRELYQSMRPLCDQVFGALRQRMGTLPEAARAGAARLLDLEDTLLARFHRLTEERISAARMRTHGDYHLGQVLYAHGDFVIIDFEGEPGRPLSERRFKRGALRDVAGMLRSFQYAAAFKVLFQWGAAAPRSAAERAAVTGWSHFWQRWACATFLRAYLDVASKGAFLPGEPGQLRTLLDAYLLEKAVYELGYEINNRPDWVTVPLGSVLEMVE